MRMIPSDRIHCTSTTLLWALNSVMVEHRTCGAISEEYRVRQTHVE